MGNFPIRGTIVYLIVMTPFMYKMISDGVTGTGFLFTMGISLPLWILLGSGLDEEDVTETN